MSAVHQASIGERPVIVLCLRPSDTLLRPCRSHQGLDRAHGSDHRDDTPRLRGCAATDSAAASDLGNAQISEELSGARIHRVQHRAANRARH